MTMAAYLMNVAATSEPPPELRDAGSLVSSNSSKSLLRPMLLLTLGLSCLASLSLQQGNVSTKSNGPGLRMACGGPGGVGCSADSLGLTTPLRKTPCRRSAWGAY